MSLSAEDSLYPIAVLIDELRNEDVALRLNSVKRLGTIALALGEERTRRELVPFLNENSDDEDEVLLVMAEELGRFVPLVGGAEYAHFLLLPLETLSTVDETVVRDKAVESLVTVASTMPQRDIMEHFVPLIKRLASKEWTARVSATRLFAPAYPRVDEGVHADLRATFVRLCKDDTPMVRRAAAQSLGAFAEVVAPECVSAELVPVFRELTQDEQDSVRLIAVEACGPLAGVLPREQVEAAVLPVMQQFAADKSWRVRYNVAQQVPALAAVLGGKATRAELLPPFVRLLRDGEAEVRAAAAGRISGVCQLLSPEDVAAAVVPAVRELAGDASQYVRAALAGTVMELAPRMGKAATIEHLLPVFLSLLRDEWPEVRLAVIGKLEAVNAVIGIELLAQSLLPAIEELAHDKHWRVRLAIIGHVPLLAGQLGAEFYEAKLGPQCLQWLQDPVYCVRQAATDCLAALAHEFGPDWARDHVVPQVLALVAHKNYLYRITVLGAVAALAPVVPRDTLAASMLPAVVSCAKDRVPNIKFNCAKMLERLAPLVDGPLVDQASLAGLLRGRGASVGFGGRGALAIKPCLAELAADSDQDVRYYAARALQAAVWAVQGKRAVSSSLEELYRAVEDLCLHKLGAKLYGLLQAECSAHVASLLAELATRTGLAPPAFLAAAQRTWDDHCSQMLLIRQIFLYLDRTYVLGGGAARSLFDMGLQLFREHLERHAQASGAPASPPRPALPLPRFFVEARVVEGLLLLVEGERSGDAVDRGLLKGLVRMLSSLGLYASALEPPLLQATDRFYAAEGDALAGELEVPAYLMHCERRLDEEYGRSAHVMATFRGSSLYAAACSGAGLESAFRDFYLSKHTGRRLVWYNGLSTCVIKAQFDAGTRELSVSLLQATVLSLFNDSERLTLAEIAAGSGIEDRELRRTLQSLACGKERVLLKEPRGRDVGDGDAFLFNAAYTSRLYRVRINAIQLKETSEENKKTNESVLQARAGPRAQDRAHAIDAAVVRIMKTRKTLSHKLLMAELAAQLRFPVRATDVKKRIESLVDREYLERDANHSDLYNYLA
eukprot:scaffold11.g4032.t1